MGKKTGLVGDVSNFRYLGMVSEWHGGICNRQVKQMGGQCNFRNLKREVSIILSNLEAGK